MQTAIGLLIQMVIVIHIALPLGTWLLLSGRRNDATRLWFISISVYSLSVCSIALRPWNSEYLSYVFAWTGACSSWLLMAEVLRRELQLRPWRWPIWVIAIGSWSLLLHAVYRSGHVATTGVWLYSCAFVGLNLLLSALVWRLRRLRPSRSLLMIQMAFAIHAGSHLNRVVQYALTQKPEYLNVFSFSWVSNLVTLSAIMVMVLICFGYWGFTLDKSNFETSQAQLGQRQAQAESHTMRALVKERDHLLMLNARVSSLSSLSSFSAMLVHDISQPLQALELGLYDLQNQVMPLHNAPQLQARIDNLMMLSGKASDMVSSLRRLMVRGQDHMDAVDLLATLQAILPILTGEAKQRGITLHMSGPLHLGHCVQANQIMLQRIVFNLVANAMDALGRHSPNSEPPRIHITLKAQHEDGQDWGVLQVQDNGPGWSDELLQQLKGPVVSSHAQGSGLGLLLTQSMVRLWGGHTQMYNHQPSPRSGAVIELWLANTPKQAQHANPDGAQYATHSTHPLRSN